MSRILPLPPDAVSQINSSKQITSLQGVVLGLLENSLDAGASKVEVIIDFGKGDCLVEDNGSGISPGDFEETGGLGKMYCTSKRSHDAESPLHGSTGTYLASLAALSLLDIQSRHRNSCTLATLTFLHSKVIGRQLREPRAEDLHDSLESGTRIAVRNLFGNMPVRVKQRHLANDAVKDNEKAFAELKHGIVALVLAWRRFCSVRLRCTGSLKFINISGYHPLVNTELTEQSLQQLAGKAVKHDLKDRLSTLFYAGLASADTRQSWVPVAASASSFTVKGIICLLPAPTKQCQFISIGIHPCSASQGCNELYDAVNKVFIKCSFGAVEEATHLDEAERDRRRHDRRFKADGYTQKQLQSKKGVDRWPMFVLQVKYRDQELAVDSISDPSLKALVEVLEAAVSQWLTTNHFRPQKHRRRKNELQLGPASASSFPRGDRLVGDVAGKGSIEASTPLKRAVTAGSASTSKKRKLFDMSGRDVDLGPASPPADASPLADLSTWSHMKSGRAVSHDGVRSIKVPCTPSVRRTNEDHGQNRKPAFDLPVIDVGALATITRKSGRDQKSSFSLSDARAAETSSRQTGNHVSSDDFGSVDEDAMLAVVECGVSNSSLTEDNDPLVETQEQDEVIEWTDSNTKQVFKINARTGVVLPSRPKQVASAAAEGTASTIFETPTRHTAAINTWVSSAGRPLRLSRREVTPAQRPQSGWLPEFLKDWNNPVFSRQDEDRIPTASVDGPGLDAAESGSRKCCTGHDLTQHLARDGEGSTSKLSKAALKRATLIKQVDDKFILCRMPVDSNIEDSKQVLVLVDQHAASERVILERLMRELCLHVANTELDSTLRTNTRSKSEIQTTVLDKPLRFQVSAQEHALYAKHAQRFADWGILYDLFINEGILTASQVRQPAQEHRVEVRTLPDAIAERCALFPNLLIELLRAEIWSLAQPKTGAITRVQHEAGDDDHAWVRRIGSCPKGIVEMLNSRACRSAIMFNDKLTHAECNELLTDLSGCAFPFVCAHGRVSMVPVVELGRGDVEGELGAMGFKRPDLHEKKEYGVRDDFRSGFRRWRTPNHLEASQNDTS